MAGEPRWCSWCDLTQYEHKYGRLPAAHLVRRRVSRQVEAELERKAWGRYAG